MIAIASAYVSASCVYDSNKRCGDHQVLNTQATEYCECETGYVSPSAEQGCVPCGVHEVASANTCVCQSGYGRNSATEPCLPCGANEVPGSTGACECAVGYSRSAGSDAGGACEAASAALGVACVTGVNACTDATINYCQMASATAGYCTTQNCTSTADCSGGYVCNLTASPTYCQRPPVGAGKACTSNDDCAGTEATYCDTFVTHTCLVQGCTLSPDNCFTGSECCDLSSYGIPQPLCLAAGACTTK